jgi:hypothetical protein
MCLNLIGKKEQALLLRPTRICSKLVYPVHLHILKLMVKFMLRVLQPQPAMLTTAVLICKLPIRMLQDALNPRELNLEAELSEEIC